MAPYRQVRKPCTGELMMLLSKPAAVTGESRSKWVLNLRMFPRHRRLEFNRKAAFDT